MNFQGIDHIVPEDVVYHILIFLDVPTLVQKMAVCCALQMLFMNTIREKAPVPKTFQSSHELASAVRKYTKYHQVDAEEFAETFWWQIDRRHSTRTLVHVMSPMPHP
eukprot:scaffold252236_cov67-Attheya_sp.AAC.1